jgi:hypothetical protein
MASPPLADWTLLHFHYLLVLAAPAFGILMLLVGKVRLGHAALFSLSLPGALGGLSVLLMLMVYMQSGSIVLVVAYYPALGILPFVAAWQLARLFDPALKLGLVGYLGGAMIVGLYFLTALAAEA